VPDKPASARSAAQREPLDPAVQKLTDGVVARDVRSIAKAITLIESSRRADQLRAEALLDALLPATGGAFRIGVSGAPGAGKSTFIEALGLHVVARGHRVAVLAVDPTSVISGGSILGDKTRMLKLSRESNAFIRPSPSGGTLGGVARKTREALALCEAAGYDVVIVETVGVGQSETAVAGMTDFFVLLALPNAGDDLQAIKRGIIEQVDCVIVNKADLDAEAAERARTQMVGALQMLRVRDPWWQPPVLVGSAANGAGVDAFWEKAEHYRAAAAANGTLAARRRAQSLAWMDALVEHELHARFYQSAAVRQEVARLRQAVTDGTMTPARAAARLLALDD